jgi:hypothetical protein
MPSRRSKRLTLADIRAMPDTPTTRNLLREYQSDPENKEDIDRQLAAEADGPAPADDSEGDDDRDE